MTYGQLKALCEKLEGSAEETKINVLVRGEDCGYAVPFKITDVMDNRKYGDSVILVIPELSRGFVKQMEETQSAT